MSNNTNKKEELDDFKDVVYFENKMRSEYNPILKHTFETKEYVSDHDLNNSSFLIQNNMSSVERIFENISSNETIFNSDILVKGSLLTPKKTIAKERVKFSSTGESINDINAEDNSTININFIDNANAGDTVVLFSIMSSSEDSLIEVAQIGDNIGFYLYSGSNGNFDYSKGREIFVYNEVSDEITTSYGVSFADLFFREPVTVNNLIANKYVQSQDFYNLAKTPKEGGNRLGATGDVLVDNYSGSYKQRIRIRYDNGFITAYNTNVKV